MSESTHPRNIISLLSSSAHAGLADIPIGHEMLDEDICDRFATWLETDLLELELKFESFITSRTLISTIR